MIHKIWASDKRFKPVEFTSGLNIILAERDLNSSQKDTRNGAGKTTLLNILHFCLGADLSRLNMPKDDLQDWYFCISIDLLGKQIVAKRSIANAKIVEVESITAGFPIQPESDSNGILFYKNDDWKKLLGICLFNLKEETEQKYKPSFRGLVSYFTRRGIDAYTDPFKYFRNQKTYDLQIHNAFLLGLNWVQASQAQELRDKESATKALSSAIKTRLMATQGELEAERVRLEHDVKQEMASIATFKVHPQYKELQEKANQLTSEIHELTNNALLIKRKLERYKKSITEEKTPDTRSVEHLFSEAGIHLAENLKRSLDEAKKFHIAIVKNRKLFLQSEVSELQNSLNVSQEKIETSTNARADLLRLLETHGALEEFSILQEHLIQKKSQLESIVSKIKSIRDMAQHRKDIKSTKLELETRLQRDYEQNRSEWEKAVVLFNKNTLSLYGEPGNLIINTTENGYKFGVEIQKSSSEGVGKMKIFCYDLMLVELMTQRNGINFLFHDSSIFDGVDSRQRALALMHASNKSSENGYQYICALNSDMVPHDDFAPNFKIEDYTRLTLSDQSAEDSLLGFHFEISKKEKKR